MFGGNRYVYELGILVMDCNCVISRSRCWFCCCTTSIKKYLQKNPPINEEVVRTMMMQMGRTPSQKQINQVMKQINQNMK